MKFEYNDTIKITSNAPKKYRPNEIGAICGMRLIESEEDMKINGLPIGTMLYTIEFNDGTDIEVPDQFLTITDL